MKITGFHYSVNLGSETQWSVKNNAKIFYKFTWNQLSIFKLQHAKIGSEIVPEVTSNNDDLSLTFIQFKSSPGHPNLYIGQEQSKPLLSIGDIVNLDV